MRLASLGMIVAVTLATILSSFPYVAAAAESRPNILFIFSDDHAQQAIGAYGSKINRTPHLDRLAAEGAVFRNSFVTNSICGPCRAVILTGKYSHLNGFRDNGPQTIFDGSQTTFPKLLQQAGYQTALVGKWHLRSDPTGFDHWNVLSGGGGQGTYYDPEMKSPQGTRKHEGYVTDITTDLALDWLRGRDQARPFMLMCQHKAPHREWQPGPNRLKPLNGDKIPEPATLFDDYSNRSPAARDQEMSIAHDLIERSDLKLGDPPASIPERWHDAWRQRYAAENKAFRDNPPTGPDRVRWNYQRYMHDYLECVAGVDDSVGRLLAYLDESGLAKNTVVIYSSDQGFYLGEHGWYDKRWMYEESLRTPLLVRWPGVVKPGSEVQAMTMNLDYAQTLLDIAGAAPPADMQGASLLPLLRGEAPKSWRNSLYYHYYEFPTPHHVEPHYGVRTERYKLIHFYRIKEWELFDLRQDPHELRSVADDPAYASIRAELLTELRRLQTRYADSDPDTYTPPPERKPAKRPKARS